MGSCWSGSGVLTGPGQGEKGRSPRFWLGLWVDGVEWSTETEEESLRVRALAVTGVGLRCLG